MVPRLVTLCLIAVAFAGCTTPDNLVCSGEVAGDWLEVRWHLDPEARGDWETNPATIRVRDDATNDVLYEAEHTGGCAGIETPSMQLLDVRARTGEETDSGWVVGHGEVQPHPGVTRLVIGDMWAVST